MIFPDISRQWEMSDVPAGCNRNRKSRRLFLLILYCFIFLGLSSYAVRKKFNHDLCVCLGIQELHEGFLFEFI